MVEVLDKSKCCGCFACYNICPKNCIDMIEDTEGFKYPKVNTENCVDCGLCQKVCPVLNRYNHHRPLKVLAASNLNEQMRYNSSSGGIFIILAQKVIKEGGVVFGAKIDENGRVYHDYACDLEGVKAFQGSKYVQSEINKSYCKVEQFLKENRLVLFTGTPCQISGLKRFLRKDYFNLLTADIICHGVPSPLVWRNYIDGIKSKQQKKTKTNYSTGENSKAFSSNNSEVNFERISFRDKNKGWKNFCFSYTMSWKGPGGEKETQSSSCPHLQDVYMNGFLNNFYLRPSCYHCPSRMGRSNSDITMADFWNLRKYFEDDDKGTSLLLLQNDKAIDFFPFENVSSNETTYNVLIESNPSYFNNHLLTYKRKQFWKYYKEGLSLEECIEKLTPHGIEMCVLSLIEIYRRIRLRINRREALK